MDSEAFNINNRFWNDNFEEKTVAFKSGKIKGIVGKVIAF
jgi:hypothetical protein